VGCFGCVFPEREREREREREIERAREGEGERERGERERERESWLCVPLVVFRPVPVGRQDKKERKE